MSQHYPILLWSNIFLEFVKKNYFYLFMFFIICITFTFFCQHFLSIIRTPCTNYKLPSVLVICSNDTQDTHRAGIIHDLVRQYRIDFHAPVCSPPYGLYGLPYGLPGASVQSFAFTEGQIDSMCTSVDDTRDQKDFYPNQTQICFKCLHISSRTRKDNVGK